MKPNPNASWSHPYMCFSTQRPASVQSDSLAQAELDAYKFVSLGEKLAPSRTTGSSLDTWTSMGLLAYVSPK